MQGRGRIDHELTEILSESAPIVRRRTSVVGCALVLFSQTQMPKFTRWSSTEVAQCR